MRLAIITCLWQRHEVERFVMDYWTRLDVPGVELEIVAVGSEGQHSAARTPDAALYVEAPNKPLGHKWNVALRSAGLLEPDAVMTLGSDNLINSRGVQLLVERLQDGDWMQPHGIHMWDVATDRLMYARFDTGAGRIYTKRLLDRMDWTLWPDDASVKLDGQAQARIIKARGRRYEMPRDMTPLGGAILDIKAGFNMWSYDTIRDILEPRPVDISAAELLDDWFHLDIEDVKNGVGCTMSHVTLH